MMKKSIYLNAIIALTILSACDTSIEVSDTEEYTISGTGEKTPLEMAVNLKDSYQSSSTRALDHTFEVGDKLVAFVEQVQRSGSEGSYSYTNKIGKKVEFTVKSIQSDGSAVTDDLTTVLYWDDFSSLAEDIRGTDKFLRVGYGFCFNGVEKETTSFTEASASITDWQILSDQSDLSCIRKSDLLWAGAQTPIQYDHDKVRPDAQEKVKLPVTYTHAMSKVTIELVLDEDSFDKTAEGKAVAFGTNETTPTLFANTVATQVDAIGQSITAKVATEDARKIKMRLADNETAPMRRVYEAIIAPTVMKDGYKLAEVTVANNKYDIVLTHDLMSTLPTSLSGEVWSTKLKAYTITDGSVTPTPADDYAKEYGGITLPGINYRLIAKLKKQRIEVEAMVKDWTDVSASASGVIVFNADVKTNTNLDGTLKNVQGSFDLWRSTTNANHGSYDENATLDGVNKATTVTYEGGKWTNTPEIYWKDGGTNYYFRALAEYADYELQPQITSGSLKSFDVAQGHDYVWGTTSEHTGVEENGTTHNYSEGAAINPRTGEVPLTFYHSMSKITVNLQTSSGDDKVNLAGATISIANLYNQGTIDIHDGKIGSLDITPASDPITIRDFYAANDGAASGTKLGQYVVVPQSLVKTKDDIDRVGAVSFYNISELTEIGGQLYITSTLDKVYYTEETAATHNESLEGHVSNGDDMIYTEAQFKALKTSEIPESLFNLFHFGYTYEEFIALDEQPFINFTNEDYETILTVYTGQGCKHNEISAKAYNAKLPGAVKAGDLQGYKVKDGDASKTAKPGDLKVNEANPVIKMLIMLEDGTTYTLNLVDCTDSNGDPVKVWQRGKHYTYNITLKKEEITFRAMVKDWDSTTGSGNATLDWD